MSNNDPTGLDAKISYERDRLVQQLAGLADALNGLSTEQLADVLPLVAGVDTIVDGVRKLGVPVTTQYPENDTLPLGGALLSGLLGARRFSGTTRLRAVAAPSVAGPVSHRGQASQVYRAATARSAAPPSSDASRAQDGVKR